MKTSIIRQLSVAGTALLVWSIAAAPQAAETPRPMKAGFAEADITPAIGMEQPGGYGKAYHRSYAWDVEPPVKPGDDGRYSTAMPGITTFR